MYVLNKVQINRVRKIILTQHDYYSPLADEIIDQTCEQIEQLMSEGTTFNDALNEIVNENAISCYNKINVKIYSQTNYSTMFLNYIKLGIRSLVKYRAISSLNLIGLTLGISVFMFIALYVNHETSYDQFHPGLERLYRLTSERVTKDGDITRSAFTGAPWGPELEKTLPAVDATVRLMKYRLPVAVARADGNKRFYEKNLIWADADFFNLFGFELVKGNPNKVLSKPDQVVLTQATALKYFGDTDPIGQTIIYEGDVELTVIGIAKNFPPNSHIQADLIGSFSSLGHSFWFNIIENWNIRYYYTYLSFNNTHSVDEVEEQVASVLSPLIDPSLKIKAQHVDKIHLNSHLDNELSVNNSIQNIIIAGVIGLTILLLSIINYINLSNARALKRTKEVGIIKAIGSNRFLIFVQFITEALLLTTMSVAVATLLTKLFLPQFSGFIGMILITPSIGTITISVIILILIITLFSGGYISFKMAGLHIIPALKGKLLSKTRLGKISLRNVLMSFQFISCLVLVTASLLISNQINYLLNEDIGYTKENTFEIPINSEDGATKNFKQALSQLSTIEATSFSSHRLSGDQLYTSSYIHKMDTTLMGRLHVDYEFLEVFDIQLLAGRTFSALNVMDTANFIINESAAKSFGYLNSEEALGQQISYLAQGDDENYLKMGEIVGVVEDFNFQSLHHEMVPMVMDIQPPRNHFISVKYLPQTDISTLNSHVKELWDEYYPNEPLSLSFVSERYQQQYQSETQLHKIIVAFGLIAMFISIFGLLGITYFDSIVRSKEIGIRKLLGSSIVSIIILFFKEYMKIIFLSSLIAIPVVIFLVNSWLNDFAYRIDISWVSVLIPVVLITVVVFSTSIFSILKSALTHPVNTLRHE